VAQPHAHGKLLSSLVRPQRPYQFTARFTARPSETKGANGSEPERASRTGWTELAQPETVTGVMWCVSVAWHVGQDRV